MKWICLLVLLITVHAPGCTAVTLHNATRAVAKPDRFERVTEAWETPDELVVLGEARLAGGKKTNPYTLRVPRSLLAGTEASPEDKALLSTPFVEDCRVIMGMAKAVPTPADRHALVLDRRALSKGWLTRPEGGEKIAILPSPPNDAEPASGKGIFAPRADANGIALYYQAGQPLRGEQIILPVGVRPETHHPHLPDLLWLPVAAAGDVFFTGPCLLIAAFD